MRRTRGAVDRDDLEDHHRECIGEVGGRWGREVQICYEVEKLKLRPNGEIAKYKARPVARGFLQKVGIDFNEVYILQ